MGTGEREKQRVVIVEKRECNMRERERESTSYTITKNTINVCTEGFFFLQRCVFFLCRGKG